MVEKIQILFSFLFLCNKNILDWKQSLKTFSSMEIPQTQDHVRPRSFFDSRLLNFLVSDTLHLKAFNKDHNNCTRGGRGVAHTGFWAFIIFLITWVILDFSHMQVWLLKNNISSLKPQLLVEITNVENEFDKNVQHEVPTVTLCVK